MFKQSGDTVSFLFWKDRCLQLGAQLPDPFTFYWREERSLDMQRLMSRGKGAFLAFLSPSLCVPQSALFLCLSQRMVGCHTAGGWIRKGRRCRRKGPCCTWQFDSIKSLQSSCLLLFPWYFSVANGSFNQMPLSFHPSIDLTAHIESRCSKSQVRESM